jgi:hypothetical protein
MKTFFSILLCGLLLNINAQNPNRCSTHDRYERLVAADPRLVQRRAQLENETQNWITGNTARTSSSTQATLVTVPVVIHVLYQNSTQNISTAQINTQITVLNQDYGRTNTDAANTPAAFQSVAANCEIQFCLASVDPSGNPTTGIERRAVTVSNIGNGNAYYQYSQGGLDIWDHTKYLNIWVCDIDGGNTLGFAYLPNTTGAADDGVVIDYNFFGTIGTVAAPYALGRTATHEVGHWFNLEHIWADEPACSADDFVTDTPQQKAENYGCPSYPQTTQAGGRCSTADPSSMFMNYMDYTDDNCMNLFTLGQKQRMQAAINGPRAGLLTSGGCGPQGIHSYNNFLSVSVFPNPSEGKFDLQFASAQKNVEVVVLNTLGEIVFRSSYINKETIGIDLSGLADGVYVAEISTPETRAARKIMINR